MKKMDGISRTKVKQYLSNGSVMVDGERTSKFDFDLQPGMTVEIGKPTAKERFYSKWLKVVYEDKYLVVIDKKEGLLTNSPTKEQDTAQSILNQYFTASQQRCRAHTIHRLDRDTSGLMLFAKDKKIAMSFEENWKEKVYDRRYVAVVEGRLEPREGTVESWLKDNKMFVTYSSPTDNGGKYAITHYQVLVSNNSLGRLCLHAYRLCFIHPVTGKEHEFETPFPKVFEKPFPQR